ncbi:hypothetical protein AX15_005935 [Amanita polypyramis BW_CC]|nr:hypothetical protein AX15_005935 [Amanita polypyramis BW_CC]
MVYIHSWQEYQDAAEALYAKSPNKARYSVKWKASEGKLVLKITDDTACIKFKTYSSIFLNRFEALNMSLMQKMQNKRQKEVPESISEPSKAESYRATPMLGTTPTAAGPSTSGAAKKKKPKKKK